MFNHVVHLLTNLFQEVKHMLRHPRDFHTGTKILTPVYIFVYHNYFEVITFFLRVYKQKAITRYPVQFTTICSEILLYPYLPIQPGETS